MIHLNRYFYKLWAELGSVKVKWTSDATGGGSRDVITVIGNITETGFEVKENIERGHEYNGYRSYEQLSSYEIVKDVRIEVVRGCSKIVTVESRMI